MGLRLYFNMETKTCPRCKNEYPLSEFFANEKRPRGTSWCRTCMKFNHDRYRASDKGKKRDAEYRKSETRKKSLERYNVSDKRKENSRRYIATGAPDKNTEKRKKTDPLFFVKKAARAIARTAMLVGELIPKDCEYKHLGNCHGRIEMHHDDYGKPKEIRWLCSRHHKHVDLGNLS